MGRQKGYVMSEETKRKIAESRAKNREAKPIVIKKASPSKSKRGPKEMTEEHKRKLAEGRARARAEKIANGLPLRKTKEKAVIQKIEIVNDKPVLKITGKEITAFDFVPLIRNTYRSMGDYISSPRVVAAICQGNFWKNTKWVLETLGNYFEIIVE